MVDADRHVIHNPISGERIVIRRTGAETEGRLLVFDLFLPPGGHVPASHVHPVQEERFTVLAGRMRFKIGRRTILANPGMTVTVPQRTVHWFGNAGPETAHALVEVRPALRMQELLETQETMAAEDRLPGTRLPRPTDLALLLSEFEQELGVPYAPRFVLRALLAPLAWATRRRASRARR
jgi:quercetin dioxygenase-like cupin family protein